ncbi:cell division protein ZapA [Thermaurantiacus sp.]
MAEVLVEVGGRSYRLACRDGDERALEAAAREFDRRAQALASALGALTEVRLLLMAGLQVTGEMLDRSRPGEELFERLAALAAGFESLAARLERAAGVEPEAKRS